MEATLVLNAAATLAEGPAWDHRHQHLVWVDIENSRVHVYHPTTGQDEVYQLDQMVGAAVPMKTEGQLLLALADGLAVFDLAGDKLTYVAKTEREIPGNRFNDGKCDPSGRFWAGTMALDFAPGAGSLYCLRPDYSVQTKVRNVTISNGLAWHSNGQTMYFIDSPTQQVLAYEYDPPSGAIGNPKVIIRIPPKLGTPDGMTIDAENKLWIALWGGYGVGHWDPKTGELLDMVKVNAPHVTSCAFGGPDLDDLYITTARSGLNAKQIRQHPESGGIFLAKPGVKGRAIAFFDA